METIEKDIFKYAIISGVVVTTFVLVGAINQRIAIKEPDEKKLNKIIGITTAILFAFGAIGIVYLSIKNKK